MYIGRFIKDNNIKSNTSLALRDKEGFIIAILVVSEIWKANKEKEAKKTQQESNAITTR